ncbi:hypothetical protein [Ruegeria sp. MALMAid1280]|uniref:hypothetical protein n=1 Tax=Ruegeria sp. MALMAid1280 TaxID=3411634 RepID=UPI003BA1BDA1
MTFYAPENRLVLACFEASRAWFSDEITLQKAISSKSETDNGEFAQFLKVWQLRRNAKACPESRRQLLKRLGSIAENYADREAIKRPGFQAEIDSLRITESQPDGLTYGRPVSMVSKFLFCKNPWEFSPYDQYTRRALNSLGASITVANYAAFVDAFDRFHEFVQKDMSKKELEYEAFKFGTKKFESNELFTRRVADKYLMLLGGFGDGRMVNDINEVKGEFPRKTRADHGHVLEPRS